MKVTFHKLWGFYYLLFMTLLKNFIADRDEAENLRCDLQAALQTHDSEVEINARAQEQ